MRLDDVQHECGDDAARENEFTQLRARSRVGVRSAVRTHVELVAKR